MTLQAHNLTQIRNDRPLFSNLHFELHPGEALWLQGPNGSGKTSLLRLLCGLATPAEGEVRWQGQPLAQQREPYLNQLAYSGHASSLKDDLLAWENVAIGAALAGQRCSRADAHEALDRLGLSAVAGQATRTLSQGQRQRVALARLFVPPLRPLLVLDEPFTALDTAAVETVSRLLNQYLAHGGLVVYTTHQPVALAGRPLKRLALQDAHAGATA